MHAFFYFFFNLAACSLFYIPPTLALRKKEKSVFAEAHKPCFYASSICPEGWPVNCSDFICSWASGLSRCYLNPCSFSYICGLWLVSFVNIWPYRRIYLYIYIVWIKMNVLVWRKTNFFFFTKLKGKKKKSNACLWAPVKWPRWISYLVSFPVNSLLIFIVLNL